MSDQPEHLTIGQILNLSPASKAALGLEFTPTEIAQQPQTWRRTFKLLESARPEIESFLTKVRPNAVTLIGAGTSDYIGRAVAPLIGRKWKTPTQAVPSTDLLTESDRLLASSLADERHLWISFSRSGDSFEGVNVLERAFEKYPEIAHLIVTCSEKGKMAADLAADRSNVLCIVLDDEVNDRGLAMTSSFTNMVVAGQCLANIHDLSAFGSSVSELADIAAESLSSIADAARQIAEKRFERICFLGSGPLKAVADESALKVLELSGGFHSTMSESFLGLRHGPLSWLNRDSLVVGFLSNDPAKANIELGLLAEVRTKNAAGSSVAIGPASVDVTSVADIAIRFPMPASMPDDFAVPLHILFAQCLGLYSSLSLGLKPDSPSSDGKITRVVSNITIRSS
ncbi:MAG: SIS domain-containing protein [Acidobacteria bacterium]|nr:SIS domain-containing protein [Acidobacteriota bacterium]